MQQLQVCLGSMCVLPLSKTGEEFEGYSTTFWEPIKSWYSFDPIVVSTMTLACFEAVKNFGSGQTCVLRNWYVLLAFNCELDVRITQDLDLSRGLFCICRAAKQTSFCFAKFCFLFLQFAHFSISDAVCCEQCVTMSVLFCYTCDSSSSKIRIRANRTYPVDICDD